MKKSIIAVGIIALVVGISLTFKKEEKELINITNNENNTLAFFIEEEGNYKGVDILPTSGYTLNEEKSFCSNGAQPTWNDNSLEILSLNSSNTNCYLYFDELCGNACKTILANVTVNEGTPDFSKTSCTTGCDEATVGLYSTEDNDGVTYYFRGDVENNYVKFAGKYWRIIRINGDGSIRLIYDGESTRLNGSTFTADTSAFNTSYSNNMYVGFKYTSGEVHGTEIESTILKALNIWYTNNLATYVSKLDMNAGFCGDRTPSTSSSTINNSGGTGTTTTYYEGYIRLAMSTSLPVFNCSREDFYTTNESAKGNNSLTNPIGLITADEVVYAGGRWGIANSKYYLYTGQHYWTLTPFTYPNARVFIVNTNGGILGNDRTDSMNGVRPVINLKADVELTGTGTMSDPYVVVGGN